MKRFVASLFLLSAVLTGLSLTGKPASAASIVFDFGPDTCTTANCEAATFGGTFGLNSESDANPFVLQVFAVANECLRLDVTFQEEDLEIVLISPSGTVWRDDDSGVGLQPQVRAITGVSGWFTLQVSHFAGGGTLAESDFVLAYGRYISGNPNCANPTIPN